jgi:hypothetical protein
MHRQAAFRQRRARERKSTEEAAAKAVKDLQAVTLPIAPIDQEPTIRRPVRVEEAAAAIAQTPAPPGLLDSTAPMTVDALQERLQAANAEISRLKEVIARSTSDGVSINIPVPPINGAGLTAETYESVKIFYSGIVLEMIKTTYAELERRNRQAYGFYLIDGEKKELNLTIAITKGESAPVSAGSEPNNLVAAVNVAVAPEHATAAISETISDPIAAPLAPPNAATTVIAQVAAVVEDVVATTVVANESKLD